MPSRHLSRPASAFLLLASLGLAAAGCDDDPGVVLDADTGIPEVDAFVPPMLDGGPTDVVPPFVVSTTPEQGAVGVAADTAIEVVFSEAMGESLDVTVSVDGTEVSADAVLEADDTTLTITPDAPLSGRVTVVLGTGFEDALGNPLSLPFELSFRIGDTESPTVTDSTPTEGATDVSRRLSAIELTFSEPMNNAMGTLTLSGGTGAIDDVLWTSNRTLRAEVEGLESATSYSVALEGFVDSAGNGLASDALEDGALDFTTRADDEAPRVTDSNPAEGQVNVRVRSTPQVIVQFDEPMDTSITAVTVQGAGAAVMVDGAWSSDGTQLTIDVGGLLVDDVAHRVDLSGLEDPAGNALDGAFYLNDGALDFRTGADSAAPRVLFSAPLEGATDALYTRDEILVVFDKAMDTSADTLTVEVGSGGSFEADVTWNLSGTRATLDVTGQLRSAESYSIDLTGLADTAGTSIDLTDVYLVDGELDFTLTAPTGEACRDELTVGEATSSTDGTFVWELPERQFLLNDGSMSCDADGVVADGVVRYTKTTADTAGGGTVLRVRLDSNQPSVREGLNLEIFRDVCDPTSGGAGAALQACRFNARVWEAYLDVGPGDYFVWVAHNEDEWAGATLTIEEVALPPEGETCLNPYTTSGAAYTPPTDTELGFFTIPDDLVDVGPVSQDMPGPVSCEMDGAQQADAVVEIPKLSATSVVRVLVDSIQFNDYNFELLDQCAPAGATSLACVTNATRSTEPEYFITGPAGSYYGWFAADEAEATFPGGTVAFEEIEPQVGSSCGNARALTLSGATTTAAVSPDVMQRLSAPSCGGSDAEFTWYRFTTSQAATLLNLDAAANLVVQNAATGAEISCSEGAQFGSAFLPASTEVCVGIESGSAVTELQIDQVAYTGVGGTATDLGILPPLTSSGSDRSLSTLRWLRVTPTTLYSQISTTGIVVAPRAGGVRADFIDMVGSTELGYGGATVGEALYVLDESTSAATRLRRIIDSSGAFSIVPWDTGTTWPADGWDSLHYDGTNLIAVNDWASGVDTTFLLFDPTTPGAPTNAGSNADLRSTVAVTADATYYYLLANDDGSSATEGLYRVPRASPTTFELIALVPLSASAGAVVLDPTGAYIYLRDDNGDIHVAEDPGGAFRYLGIISTIGDSGDDPGLAWDPVANTLIAIDTESDPHRFVRLD